MIKLRQLISEAVIACGECVSWAWKFYMTNQRNKRAKVVFGTVQNKWISNGRRFPHVWIVDSDNKVKDWQTMDPKGPRSGKYALKGMPKRWFKEVWNPKVDRTYGMEEAAEHYKRTKTMLGWKW
jgi:hypothetical protein